MCFIILRFRYHFLDAWRNFSEHYGIPVEIFGTRLVAYGIPVIHLWELETSIGSFGISLGIRGMGFPENLERILGTVKFWKNFEFC